jgi:hypothetical protein
MHREVHLHVEQVAQVAPLSGQSPSQSISPEDPAGRQARGMCYVIHSRSDCWLAAESDTALLISRLPRVQQVLL